MKLGTITHKQIKITNGSKISSGERITRPTKVAPKIEFILKIAKPDSGIFLHVLQFDMDTTHTIALVTRIDYEQFFVDSSHEYFVKANKENFHKLGYRSVLEASYVDWTLVMESTKKNKKRTRQGVNKNRTKKKKTTKEHDQIVVENKTLSSTEVASTGRTLRSNLIGDAIEEDKTTTSTGM